MKTKNDDFGNRMKFYESETCGIKMDQTKPIVARLDGKGFSKFTKGLKRPYDERLSNLMIETTKYLVKETNANCGYIQSDEITLVWYNENENSSIYFDGKLFKMIGDLSAMASVFFNSQLGNYLPEKMGKLPRFDCRVFNVPTTYEAVNTFLWREQDATKNSISMAAQHYFSHSSLLGKNGLVKKEMLKSINVDWEDYPSFFKRGSYIQRKKINTKFSTDEIEKLPLKHNARINPEYVIERSFVDKIDLPPLEKISNKIDVILFGKDYIKNPE